MFNQDPRIICRVKAAARRGKTSYSSWLKPRSGRSTKSYVLMTRVTTSFVPWSADQGCPASMWTQSWPVWPPPWRPVTTNWFPPNWPLKTGRTGLLLVQRSAISGGWGGAHKEICLSDAWAASEKVLHWRGNIKTWDVNIRLWHVIICSNTLETQMKDFSSGQMSLRDSFKYEEAHVRNSFYVPACSALVTQLDVHDMMV